MQEVFLVRYDRGPQMFPYSYDISKISKKGKGFHIKTARMTNILVMYWMAKQIVNNMLQCYSCAEGQSSIYCLKSMLKASYIARQSLAKHCLTCYILKKSVAHLDYAELLQGELLDINERKVSAQLVISLLLDEYCGATCQYLSALWIILFFEYYPCQNSWKTFQDPRR